MKRTEVETKAAYKRRRFQVQLSIKNYLKGRIFYNNQFTPYVKPKRKNNTISFTEALRNKKGYNKTLTNRFNA